MPGPLLSLFTPTHSPRYLEQAHASLRRQDYPHWEWVVVPNGPVGPADLPETIRRDPHVRIVPGPAESRIGALKRFACQACRGQMLIEMDHDDLLVPGVLSRIAAAAEAGAGFVYSDVAVFEDDLHSWSYSADYGWQRYPVVVYGRPFWASQCFPLSPRSLCEVYYAPDHVRAWSRQAYAAAGGHDPALGVADDHDLVCRTYLSGASFQHLGGCGYLYRAHAANTVKATAPLIAQLTGGNRRRYWSGLVREWCRRQQLPVLDLLAAWRKGAWSPGPFEEKSPLFKEDHYGHIIASDVLQFAAPEAQVAIFNQLYRLLVPGGCLSVLVPAERGRYARQNPLHRSVYNPNSFLYYARREFAANCPGVACRFDLVGEAAEELYPTPKFKAHDMLMLQAELVALKGQVHPGPRLI